MNTARLNQGTPLLLNAVTKKYAANTVLNQLDRSCCFSRSV